MLERSIRAAVHLPRQQRAPGFEVALLHPESVGGGFDPFLQIDAFALAAPVFKPHPHAGFSAVTYILPDSPIGFINRDSLGGRQRIGPGALHWTAAGRGLLHEEVPEQLGVAALGLQMFIDLPLSHKEAEPFWLHLKADEIPRVQIDGADIRAVVGASNGAASPLQSPTPGVRLIDVDVAPGGRFAQTLEADESASLYILSGSATAGPEGAELRAFDLAATQENGDALVLRAGDRGVRFVLFGGAPLRQPIVSQGPFVMATHEQMRRAVESYTTGRMGRLDANRYAADGRPVL